MRNVEEQQKKVNNRIFCKTLCISIIQCKECHTIINKFLEYSATYGTLIFVRMPTVFPIRLNYEKTCFSIIFLCCQTVKIHLHTNTIDLHHLILNLPWFIIQLAAAKIKSQIEHLNIIMYANLLQDFLKTAYIYMRYMYLGNMLLSRWLIILLKLKRFVSNFVSLIKKC